MFDLRPFRKRGEKDISRYKREFENMFDRFFQGNLPSVREFFQEDAWMPKVDVAESKKMIEIKAELPGMEADDIDVRLDGMLLQIRGEKKQDKEEKEKNYHRIERRYGSFHRTIELPAEVDQERVEASFKKGILKIVLNKLKVSDSKKIEIKSA